MFIIVLGHYVSILIGSSSGPSKEIDPYLELLKCAVGSQNAYILDITMYRMHSIHSYVKNVSVCDTTAHFNISK